ncbi:hypothetical protein RhiJN_28760 [Ceratobasidium sp. AG-Ba]|nr:hypothetical protein RhiJN_28760 [Ceratobasidium sp. AG-Ba]
MPAQQRPSKPRKVPAFASRHLDPHRARQLKKEWLATQKIKAAYRAEKRRLGLRKPATSTDDGAQGENIIGSSGTAAEAQLPDEDVSEHDMSDRSSIGDDRDSHPIVKVTKGDSNKTLSDTVHPKRRRENKGKEKVQNTSPTQPEAPSLRDLARDAYSPASLHTHKSNPLHRKQHGADYARRRVEAAAGRGGRGRSSGRGSGRGQPDMAKRMGVLLEQIKRRT